MTGSYRKLFEGILTLKGYRFNFFYWFSMGTDGLGSV